MSENRKDSSATVTKSIVESFFEEARNMSDEDLVRELSIGPCELPKKPCSLTPEAISSIFRSVLEKARNTPYEELVEEMRVGPRP